MQKPLDKLNKHELIELYKENVEKSRNSKNKIVLVAVSAAYLLLKSKAPVPMSKIDLNFYDKLGDSIFDLYKDSSLLKEAIERKSEINKSSIIQTLGLVGIKGLDQDNSKKLPDIIDCIVKLYLIYLQDSNFDMAELLSIMRTDSQNKPLNDIHSRDSTSTENRKFNNIEEYYQFLSDKLNEQGFKEKRLEGLVSWEVRPYFLSNLTANNPVNYEAYKYLKDLGYFNLGICPQCGNQIDNIKFTYTSGFNSDINYPICKDCYDSGQKMSINPANDKKGCYIATVCYGDVDSVEVVMFRKYRDDVLIRSILGRIFIKIYYCLSPSIANFLNGKRSLNIIIRKHILDKIFARITKMNV